MKKVIRYSIYYDKNPEVDVDVDINRIPWTIPHTHDYWEIVFMIEGECFHYINEKECLFRKGDIQLLRPDDLHYCRKSGNAAHVLLNLQVKRAFFEKTLKSFNAEIEEKILCEKFLPKFKCGAEFYDKVMNLLAWTQLDYDVQNTESQFRAKVLVMALLTEILYLLYGSGRASEESVSEELLSMMHRPENIALKLNELCAKYPCSVEFAIRHFKKEKNITPNIAFRDVKLNYACGLLRTTEYKIITIAEKIGLNNVGYFNKLFFEKYEMTPSEYRKRYYIKRKIRMD